MCFDDEDDLLKKMSLSTTASDSISESATMCIMPSSDFVNAFSVED